MTTSPSGAKVIRMPLILDGKKARDFYKARLIERVSALPRVPTLAILQIGNNPESTVYIEQKKRFGAAIGAKVDHIHLPESSSQADVAETVSRLNRDVSIDGVIIQLPLPSHLDKLALINLIDPEKDVDGLTDENQRLLDEGRPSHIPATAKGVGLLLDFYGIESKGKRAAIMGRSRLVGHPTANVLKLRGADTIVCHSKTLNPQTITKAADILVVAIGKPRLIGPEYVKAGAVVVDVGINALKTDDTSKRKVVGDVDFEAVQSLTTAISPVPGGVGPMTVLSLFDNLISSAERNRPRKP